MIIGPHGGGLTNIVFAPITTKVIEFMPVDRKTKKVIDPVRWIYFLQSRLIGHIYWMITADLLPSGDITVDAKKVLTALESNVE